MKFKKLLIPILAMSLTYSLVGCSKSENVITTSTNPIVTTQVVTTKTPFTNPGDYLGGGSDSTVEPTKTSVNTDDVKEVINKIEKTDVSYDLDSATPITNGGSIDASGTYLLTGTINLTEAISFSKKATDVTLIIKDANITVTDDKAITSKKDLNIIFLGENTITNSLGEANSDENLIKCGGNLTISGTGTTTLNSTKSGIKVDGLCNLFSSTLNIASASHGINASRIYVDGANLNITSTKDGLHAEIDYDEVESASDVTFTLEDGFIYIKSGTITINSVEDGIQADTFAQIDGGTISITTNGGAPSKITEQSSDNAQGKGIKAGYIDYTLASDPDTDIDLEVTDYAIIINDGTITINSNDDAIHSNGYFLITGGTATISTGDDGLHAETIGEMTGGTYTVLKSYEGYEAAKVQISGGTLDITAADDGINAADGTETRMGQGNSNCYLIISGGTITVNASGDGVDSNNSILISGGSLYIDGPTNGGNAALDSEVGIIINGGEVVAAGALGMVETPSTNSSQYVVSYAQQQQIQANTVMRIIDEDNNVVLEYTVRKVCQSVIMSNAKLTQGKTYKLYGGSTLLSTFTISNKITSIGSSTQSQNPGGRPRF